MNVELLTMPMDNDHLMEQAVASIMADIREGAFVHREALDWLDFANNHLDEGK